MEGFELSKIFILDVLMALKLNNKIFTIGEVILPGISWELYFKDIFRFVLSIILILIIH